MQKKSLRVLLIEHDEAFARIVQELLAGANEAIGEVVLARSFENGLTLASGAEFDAVLLEFFLPDGAGLTNIALLKERSPRIPILAFGVADEETIAVEAVHSGAQDYLVKGQLSTRWLVRSIHYAIERQHLDLALLDAEEKYRSLFNHLVEGIFRTSPDGRYLMANSALAKIYGYSSPEELMSVLTDIGKRLYVQTGRREEFRRTMEQHDTITAFESQIYRKDGSTIWISENCHAIRDVQGRLLYYEGTVEDITQRRVAEEDLRHSEALYHSDASLLQTNSSARPSVCLWRKLWARRITIFSRRTWPQNFNGTIKLFSRGRP
jgi:PAS domain S-box-containing protein